MASMREEFRDRFGYLIGFTLFVVGVPLLMYVVSAPPRPSVTQLVLCFVLACAGLALSIWSIVHMKRVGRGNPLDAFGYEVAPRTQELMTDGPYALCRNPMLLGVLIYYGGLLVAMPSWKTVVIILAFAAIMFFQVKSEETRLEADFGDAYLAYKETTPALIPYYKSDTKRG